MTTSHSSDEQSFTDEDEFTQSDEDMDEFYFMDSSVLLNVELQDEPFRTFLIEYPDQPDDPREFYFRSIYTDQYDAHYRYHEGHYLYCSCFREPGPQLPDNPHRNLKFMGYHSVADGDRRRTYLIWTWGPSEPYDGPRL